MIAIWRLGGKLSRRVEMALKAAAEYLESGQGKLVTQKKAASRDVTLLDAVRLLEVTELVSVYLLVLPTCRLLVTEKTPGTPLARILAASLSA